MSAPRGLLNSSAALPRLRLLAPRPAAAPAATTASAGVVVVPNPVRCLTTAQEGSLRQLPGLWFNSSSPRSSIPPPDGLDKRKPGDDRTVKLGKTLRILQERLPTLLQSPLPQEILAPNISLHLFPSTHPHLPAVSGRVAYVAALWTSPIAWNRVPIVGNVKLEILSERMSKEVLQFAAGRTGAVGERLVVRWRTVGRNKPAVVPGESKDFTGLFIFEFDSEGRVLSHTIEHVQEAGDWESGVGAKFVGLTDWLLGGIKGQREPPLPVAFHSNDDATMK